MTLYCSPRARTGKRRGTEGSGLYPELAAYRISEGNSPNVQAEVGRLVGLLPIELARAELARKGLDEDEKAVRRIAGELGAQMLATRTRDLMRFRAGELPAGKEFAGKSVAAEIDGGRLRVRTIVEKIRVGGQMKRKKFRVEWREPKVVILFEVDKKGRMVRGSRPFIEGTLQGPDALIELVAFHLHRMGAAKAKVVTFAADGAPMDLEAVGLDRRPGQAGSMPGGRGARLVSRSASRERGIGGFVSGRVPAEGALQPASGAPQRGQESHRDQRVGGAGGRRRRGFVPMA